MTTKKKPASLEDFVFVRHGKTMVEARIISSDGAPKPPTSSIGSTSDDDNDGWIYVQYLINSAVKQYVLASNVTPMYPEVDEQAESNRFPPRSTRRTNHPKAAPATEFARSSRMNAEACAAPPLKKPRHQDHTVEILDEQTNKSSALELNDRDGLLQAQCSALLPPKDDCEVLKPTTTSGTTATKHKNLSGTELEKVLKPTTKSIPTKVTTNIEYAIGTEVAKVSTRSCNWDQRNNGSYSSLFSRSSFLSFAQYFYDENGKNRLFTGHVIGYDDSEKYYLVRYEDGDEEEYSGSELALLIVNPATKQVPRMPPEWVKPNNLCLMHLHGLAPAAAQQIRCFPAKHRAKVAEFFLFVSERQRVWERRSRGDAEPWSACPLFQQYSWCNNYRELDRGTAFFRAHVLDVKDANPGATKSFLLRRFLFDSYLYRQCNRVETFLTTGFPLETKLDLGSFFGKLTKIQADGRSVFTGAHQTTNIARYQQFVNNSTKKSNGQSLLDQVCEGIVAAKDDMRLILTEIRRLEGVGSFLSWQILCDLQEAQCVDTTGDDYCVLGPGAVMGLSTIFPNAKSPHLELAQQLAEHHDQVYSDLGVEFPFWRGRPLTIKEIEHALCEFSKFSRIVAQMKSNGKSQARVYRSRAALDSNKPCLHCKGVSDDGLLCDTCNLFFCAGCAKSSSESVSWVCHRCEAFEQGVVKT